MPRSIRVRPDLIPRVKLAVKHNGFLRQKDLVEEVGLASSTVRNFLNGKPVDYATFVQLCQRLNLEWRDFADLGEITERHRESEEAVIAQYSTSETEKNTPDALDLAEREEVISKPNIQIEENNTDQIEERIFRATEQLNRRGFSTLVGIQALEEIAKDSSRYHWKIMEVLAAFVINAPQRKEEEGIPDDIQAALTVIGQRNPDSNKKSLNLRNTNLAGVDLSQLNFEQVDFTGASLKGANLSRASLKGVNFKEANLESVNLNGADLESANLFQTVLSKANLRGVHLEKAILIQTDLSLAYLERANLKGTRLDEANLKEADLSGANLSESYLNKANLEGVKLTSVKSVSVAKPNQIKVTEVNMEGAVFWGANLKGANFSKAKNLDLGQLSLAEGDSTTVLPDYVEAPPHWMQVE